MNWLVVGYGNTLYGDDGFGPALVESISKKLIGDTSIQTAVHRQLLPELAEQLSETEAVIFADVNINLPSGKFEIVRLNDKGYSTALTSGIDAHCLTIPKLLQSTVAVFGSCPRAWLCSVGPYSMELGSPISPALERLIPQAIESVLVLIRNVTDETEQGA